jgi:hypothetical protein
MVDLKDQDVLLEGKLGLTNEIIQNTPKYALKLGKMNFVFDLGDEAGAKAKKAYKDTFSGNYDFEEYYCLEHRRFQHRIRFDTPEDKTIFLLRYG